MSAPLLLFVCMGNICRSPMAQAIAEDEARKTGCHVRIASAGLAALEGHDAHELAHGALADIGVALVAHRAKQLTRDVVDEAKLVVTATSTQRDDLRHFFKGSTDKIVSFDDVTGLGDLSDPFDGGPDAFKSTADMLRRGMPAILKVVTER